jgi:hypothetical protein
MYKPTLTKVPVIDTKKELKKYVKTLYIIDDFMDNIDGYYEFIKEVGNIVKAIFVKEDDGFALRKYPVKFKFYVDDDKTLTLEIRSFLYNIMCWYPICELHGIHVLDESFILLPEQIPRLEDYTNDKLISTLQNYNIKQTIINKRLSHFKFMMRGISLDFSDLMNLTFSDKTFIDMHNNPRYRDLMEIKLPDNAQATEVEEILDNAQHQLINRLKEDGKNDDYKKRNPVGVILLVGSGMKEKQLTEYLIAMGMKPTLTGEVMPIAIENSSLIKGLDRPSYMYIDATGARKPLKLLTA